MEKQILIYCEGGFNLGLGNVYRSISLAGRICLHENIIVNFVTSSDSYVQEIIRQKGFSVKSFKDQKEVFQYIIEVAPQVLVIDYLDISASLVEKVNDKGIKIAIIGNDSEANREAHLVVNAIIGTDFKNRSRIDSFGTRYLEGPRYLVLRNEFTSRRESYIYKKQLNTIALLFGGTDQANLSCKVLKDLIDSGKNYHVILILGAGYKYESELNQILNENKKLTVQILHNIDNVAETLLKADFLVTSAGTALFEAFCLGIPSVAFFQNESQQKVFGDFFMTQKYEDVPNFIYLMNSVYENIDSFRQKLSELNVGQGESEIVDNIINL